jgi:hypothetical protein
MQNSRENIQEDIHAISQIPIVPTLLEVICRTTGMGFAAIARVTEEKWVACGVYRTQYTALYNPTIIK